MPQMKVFNDNEHPYTEKFKDQIVTIPPKGFVVMDFDDAHQFKGTFAPPVLDTDGRHLPQGYKMIRIEPMSAEAATPVIAEASFQCNACKYKGSSATDLAEHGKTAHADEIVTDEAAEQELKAKRKRAS